MKKWMTFGGGFLVGALVTFLILLVVGLSQQSNGGLSGATYFDEPTQTIKANSFEVFQVLQDNAALVRSKANPRSSSYFGPIYLMVNNSEHYYYDDEIIDVPRGSQVLQLGVYKYKTQSDDVKTVPIIGITKK